MVSFGTETALQQAMQSPVSLSHFGLAKTAMIASGPKPEQASQLERIETSQLINMERLVSNRSGSAQSRKTYSNNENDAAQIRSLFAGPHHF